MKYFTIGWDTGYTLLQIETNETEISFGSNLKPLIGDGYKYTILSEAVNGLKKFIKKYPELELNLVEHGV